MKNVSAFVLLIAASLVPNNSLAALQAPPQQGTQQTTAPASAAPPQTSAPGRAPANAQGPRGNDSY